MFGLEVLWQSYIAYIARQNSSAQFRVQVSSCLSVGWLIGLMFLWVTVVHLRISVLLTSAFSSSLFADCRIGLVCFWVTVYPDWAPQNQCEVLLTTQVHLGFLSVGRPISYTLKLLGPLPHVSLVSLHATLPFRLRLINALNLSLARLCHVSYVTEILHTKLSEPGQYKLRWI